MKEDQATKGSPRNYSCNFKILEYPVERAGIYRHVVATNGKCVGFIDASGHFQACHRERQAIGRIKVYKAICALLLLVCFIFASWLFVLYDGRTSIIPNKKNQTQENRATNDEAKLMETLARRAGALNKNLPFMIDNALSLNAVTVESPPSKQMTFHYQILAGASYNFDKDKFHEVMRQRAANRACNDLELIHLLQKGATICFSYYGSDNGLIGDVRVTRQDCQKDS